MIIQGSFRKAPSTIINVCCEPDTVFNIDNGQTSEEYN